MRTNFELDDALVAEAFSLTGIHTKRELIDLALREMVQRRRKKNLFELAGKVSFRPNYDHQEFRRIRDSFDGNLGLDKSFSR